jgi:RNA polymerase sigma-70 factor (ECF subfamily)
VGPTDAELIARVLERDDRHAFATIVRRHQSQIRAVLRRLTSGDAAWADDLAQETFLSAYRNLRQFRGESRLSSWFYRIAYTRWLDSARTQRDRPEANDEPTASVRSVERADARHDLERGLSLLRPAERAALALTYAEDMTHEEAANILEMPLGTLKTLVRASLQKLRRALEASPERTDTISLEGANR